MAWLKLLKAILLVSFGMVSFTFASGQSKNLDAIGEQKTAVFLIDLLGDGSEIPREDFEIAVFKGQYSVDSFIREASYGRAWLEGKAYEWVKWYGPERCELSFQEIYELTKHQVNWAALDRVAVAYHRDKNCNQGFGHSTFGKVGILGDNGPIQVSVAEITANYRLSAPKLPFHKLSGLAMSVLAHEFGHSFGVRGHSNLWDCGKSASSKNGEGCQQEAIADTFAIMGGDGVFRSSLHHSACHKEDLGWIQREEVKNLSLKAGDSSIVELGNYENNDHGLPLTIKIQLKKPIPVVAEKGVYINSLFLEFRSAVGYNGRLVELSHPQKAYKGIQYVGFENEKVSIDYSGVQVRGGFFKYGHCITSYLFDTKPDSLRYKEHPYSLYDALDGFLNLGDEFLEEHNNIKISLIKISHDKVTVRIDAL